MTITIDFLSLGVGIAIGAAGFAMFFIWVINGGKWR
jgi:hypothetical protein